MPSQLNNVSKSVQLRNRYLLFDLLDQNLLSLIKRVAFVSYGSVL